MTINFKRLAVLFAVCLSAALINLDMAIVNLALPTIGLKLHVPLSMLQWIVVAYLITAAVSFIVGGRLTDKYGAKRIGCLGTWMFLLGSVVSGLAIDGWLIAAGRAIQGIGFGLTIPALLGISCSQFPPEKKASAVAVIIIAAGITQCIGPTLGGTIIHWLSWRWIFFINIPICAIFLLLIGLFQKQDTPGKSSPQLTYSGVIAYFFFIFALIYATEILETRPINWSFFSFAIAISAIMLTVSYYLEKRKDAPTVPFYLLKNKRYRSILLIRCFVQTPFFVYLFFMPFLYKGVYHLTAYESGLNLLYLSAGFGVFALFSSQMTRILGFRRCILVGCCLSFASSLIILFFSTPDQVIWVNIGILVAGASSAFIIVATVSNAIESVKPEKMGQATGLFYSATVGVSVPISIAITGVIMAFTLAIGIPKDLHAAGISLDASQLHALATSTTALFHIQTLQKYFSTSQLTLIRASYEHLMSYALSLIAIFTGITALVGALILARLKKKETS